MRYEIQAKSERWNVWSAEYIGSDEDATRFDSEDEAKAAIEDLRRENPAYTGEYRIVEVE